MLKAHIEDISNLDTSLLALDSYHQTFDPSIQLEINIMDCDTNPDLMICKACVDSEFCAECSTGYRL